MYNNDMSWLDNAVIYQIFIDRFAGFKNTSNWRKPVFVGGNIRGIIDKIPYIKKLGANAIWISPFNTGVAYHGYHITDFFGVDNHFGSENDIKDLIKLAHDQSIKVICDFAPNHCSNQHPFFLDAIKNQDSKYNNWFIFDSWPSDYRCFKTYKELPKINLDNELARTHLLDSARKWLSLGFDGFRIDHIIGVSNDNLKKMIIPLRSEFPDAVFIGEAWFKGVESADLKTLNVPHKYLIWVFHLKNFLYKNYVGIVDGVLNFQTAKYLEKYVLTGREKYLRKITTKHNKLDGFIHSVTFLDNHDMERFLFRCGGDVDKLKKAASAQFSIKGPAAIYYGTEIGMSQNAPFSKFESHADIMAREPMYWDKSKQNTEYLNIIRS